MASEHEKCCLTIIPLGIYEQTFPHMPSVGMIRKGTLHFCENSLGNLHFLVGQARRNDQIALYALIQILR